MSLSFLPHTLHLSSLSCNESWRLTSVTLRMLKNFTIEYQKNCIYIFSVLFVDKITHLCNVLNIWQRNYHYLITIIVICKFLSKFIQSWGRFVRRFRNFYLKIKYFVTEPFVVTFLRYFNIHFRTLTTITLWECAVKLLKYFSRPCSALHAL